ncbi:uncharacterized protein LDX57_010046 [Aspergillus melleus]|uniref:uncharacterized protein n=1 Tax=Aspergillus melleus TaxID=138277 RepID=UPI001E8DFAD7|nr:uncharacterized protein LDX57_010046 [Aspergillus melleus]KAH8432407.1 hypothetical protein LDX57_010046 [Aspergillus melleus]
MKYAAISIPASYGRLDSSPTPGTVAGIILGSVCGFIFLLYLIYLGLSSGRRFSGTPSTIPPSGTGTEISEAHSGRSSRFRRRRRDDIVEVEEGGRGGTEDGESRIVVEESMTSRSRDDGVVEVIEEEDGRSHRPSRAGTGRKGGYRRDRYEDSEYGSSRF